MEPRDKNSQQLINTRQRKKSIVGWIEENGLKKNQFVPKYPEVLSQTAQIPLTKYNPSENGLSFKQANPKVH